MAMESGGRARIEKTTRNKLGPVAGSAGAELRKEQYSYGEEKKRRGDNRIASLSKGEKFVGQLTFLKANGLKANPRRRANANTLDLELSPEKGELKGMKNLCAS